MEGREVALVADGRKRWSAELSGGRVCLESRATRLGLLLVLTYQAKTGQPSAFAEATVKVGVSAPSLYYVPAYAWNWKPVEAVIGTYHLQTRLAVLEKDGAMLCLIAGSDRGTLGVSTNVLQNTLMVDPCPMPLLLSAVKGDCWRAYQFAVRDVEGFEAQKQTVPVSEITQGVSRYMMTDEVWEPELGTVKSWPARDPHTKLYKDGFDAFAFYGTPYSVPLYLSRYQMTGDRQALERATSIVGWLCNSGVRVQDGPARGAFFNSQRFTGGEKRDRRKQGCT